MTHSSPKTLYLGIDPTRWKSPNKIIHYPLIRTQLLPNLPPFHSFPITHVLFTSRATVKYLPIIDAIPLAIGEGTASALRDISLHPLLAPFPTQEGMIALLKTLDLSRAFCLYPHSRLARPLLRNFLQEANIPHFAFPLYDTLTLPSDPLPNLDEFHEVVFTSPSTVRAFLEVFKTAPPHLTLTPIGEVTARVLACAFSNPRI